MNKTLIPVNLSIESNLDADDLGSRITSCIKQCNPDYPVVNLIKIEFDTSMRTDGIHQYCEMINRTLHKSGITNYIIVPISKNGITDIKIDYLKVIDEELENVAEKH